MAKKTNFKEVIKNELKEENNVKYKEQTNSQEQENKIITKQAMEEVSIMIPRKQTKSKQTKKSFPVYMDTLKAKKLDKICRELGYNRNEFINIMLDLYIEGLEQKKKDINQ